MECSRVSALAAALLLCLHLAQAGLQTPEPKPGRCPESSPPCGFVLLPECLRDGGCQGVKKCCYYNCKRQCVVPL
ncbi:WAP four-disulfide core domain protein 15A-like [Tamandua tetradactyla]|uniref:WAP four-disulfide core domain protein 15A-like n=1 Tax=Tamandua tetradactyla TaxID=48850 RepID=UPI0040546E12